MEKFSWCDFVAGWTGGILGLAVGHPFDTLKVRQQTLPGGGGIMELAKSTYKIEGVRGFFKGLSYPLLGAGVYNALFFGVYGNSLRYLQGPSVDRKMCCEGGPVNDRWHWDVFVAGCIGGVATVLYSCPLELIKIKLQAQTATLPTRNVSVCKRLCRSEPVYSGPFDALKTIYKKYGIYRGLYKGTITMMWRDVPTFGLYTVSYEHLLCMLRDKEDRSSGSTVTAQFIAGGIAGIVSTSIVAPLDVVKTRIQVDHFKYPIYAGAIDCFIKMYRNEGFKSLFIGFRVGLIRAFPTSAVRFVVYEYVLKACEDFRANCGSSKPATEPSESDIAQEPYPELKVADENQESVSIEKEEKND